MRKACHSLAVAAAFFLNLALASAQTLTYGQYQVGGFGLEVSPPVVTVPRDVPSSVTTNLVGISTAPIGSVVRARVRGPSIPTIQILTGIPGGSLQLPGLSQAGIHFLEDIELVLESGELIAADPPTVSIDVLDEFLVTSVVSRPLSLEEIRALGIEFDENSFQAFSFTVAFTTSSGVVEIDFPVLMPIVAGEEQPRFIQPPGFQSFQQIPGLPNISLAPAILEPIEEIKESLPPGVEIPPIPGVVVIPGNVAFLNQFFSVLLLVSNEAPDGTPLVVRDVEAEIVLPPGQDGVPGDITSDPPYAPGDPEFDNPLRIAKLADEGRVIVRPVLSAGPDGEEGTGDDENRLVPQGRGSAEFFVEGVRQGNHIVEIELRGILDGLPGGPIEISGITEGAVVVRDPSFSITFIHPNTVRAGEVYELRAHLQNTSDVDANLVTVCLEERNLSGARFVDSDDSCQLIETIFPGESGVAVFPLEALRTGRVNASTLELDGEGGVISGRRISLVTGIGESGAPTSPDTLILPPSTGLLRERANNDDLLFRALALLGEAHSIATAPRGSLPPGVSPIVPGTVIQRARELTEAALRLDLSVRPGPNGQPEPLPDGLLLTLQDLHFDFLGAGSFDFGWDSLFRSSRQARLFAEALAEVLGREMQSLGFADLIELQQSWADTESYRDAHVSIATQGGTTPAFSITDSVERTLGGSLDPEGGDREFPGGDVLTFPGSGQLALLTRLESSRYGVAFDVATDTTFDLGIVAPGSDGQLRQFVVRSLSVAPGDVLSATIRPRTQTPVLFELNGQVLVPAAELVIVDGPPEILGVIQNADREVDRFGRVVAILFDEEVDPATATPPGNYAVSDNEIAMLAPPNLIDGNAARQALVQFGNRIVFVGMRDPVGPFRTRTLDIVGVRDLRGQEMDPALGVPILADPDIENGATLTGRVRRADGTPVANAEITYRNTDSNQIGRFERTISVKPADAEGGYGFDFVLKSPDGPFRIRARDPITGEEGELSAAVAIDGQRLNLDIVLAGRGSVEGTVRDQNGQPIAGAFVQVSSSVGRDKKSVLTDQNGLYVVNDIPVGGFGVEAVTTQGRARASGAIIRNGETAVVDVTIFPAAPSNATLAGQVRFPDGSIAPGVDVFLGFSNGSFIDRTTSDEGGTFAFDGLAASSYLVRALDVAQGLTGETTVSVPQSADVFASVTLAGTGSVTGRVFGPDGVTPVPGALVAGGTEIVTADENGDYFIPIVPVGIRTIEAADPETGNKGATQVSILVNGQASAGIDIVLEPRGRVTGRVLDPSGAVVPGQEVRLLVGTSFDFGEIIYLVRRTNTAADGTYAFDQLDLKSFPLMAVRGREVANGRVHLSSTRREQILDLQLVAPNGSVEGTVVQGGDQPFPIAAEVSLSARVPNAAGLLEFRSAGTIVNDPDRGFRFEDLFPGRFSVTARSFFSSGGETATLSGTLPDFDPNIDGIVLTLIPNEASLRGRVLDPEGEQILPILDGDGIPLPLPVCISSNRLRSQLDDNTPAPCFGSTLDCGGICVDASDGTFESTIALPADLYTIVLRDERSGSPTEGLSGRSTISLSKAQDGERDVRLLGEGNLLVDVVDGMGDPMPGVHVTVRRTSFPSDTRQALLLDGTMLFENLTEGSISVSAVVSTDPLIDVGGREDLRGFGGNASTTVVRGSTQMVEVRIADAGRVTGRFLLPDGVTPIPNAQVELRPSGLGSFFDVTDADGAFSFNGVPRRSYSLEGVDPVTNRYGRAGGRIDFDGQEVVTNIELGPLGSVVGVVLDADQTTPVAGAEVQLLLGSSVSQTVTADAGGEFAFQSVPGGAFSVRAFSPGGLSGQASGRIDEESQEVAVEVVIEGSGRVEGTVFDAFGQPVPDAEVTLRDARGSSRFAQTSSDTSTLGQYSFDIIPLGGVSVTARPLGALTPGDGGSAGGVVEPDDETITVDVTFQGTMTVGIEVEGTVGAAPVSARVDSSGLFGGRVPLSTVDNGVFLFEGVPLAPFTAAASQTTPIGTTISASTSISQVDLPGPGERVDVVLQLSQVATVVGEVVHPEGESVSGTLVLLQAGGVASQQLVGDDGVFEFSGVPLNANLTVEADGSAGARALFRGRIDGGGNVLDEEDIPIDPLRLILDLEPPMVTAVLPNNGGIDVPTTSVIDLTFSEEVDVDTLTTCTGQPQSMVPAFYLVEAVEGSVDIGNPSDPCDDGNVIPLDAVLSLDGRTVTLTPLVELSSLTSHTLVVDAGTLTQGALVGGVRDLVGKALEAPFITSFTTVDNVAPALLTLSPPDGAVEVDEENLVRATFSEALSAATISEATVRIDGPGGPVSGLRSLVPGGTVVVFTPTDGSGGRAFFDSDSTYTITIDGVEDLAGNPLQTPVQASFVTRDTIAPEVSMLVAVPAAAREGDSIVLVATVPDTDIDTVEFFVDGVLESVQSQRMPSGAFEATITMPDAPIAVRARAIDQVGNIGQTTGEVVVPLLPDNPPSVSITAPTAGTTFLPGEGVRFSVDAADDVGVASVRGVTSGEAANEQTRNVAPPLPLVSLDFDVTIPTSAATGTISFAAVATDTRGQMSALASIEVEVNDPTPPVVNLLPPANGVALLGETLNVTVQASDAAGIVEVVLEAPQIAFAQTVEVAPAETDTSQAFTLPVPAPLAALALDLTATATDRSGNQTSVALALPVVGPFEIDAVATTGVANDSLIASANVQQTITLLGQGLGEVAAALFDATDAAGDPVVQSAGLFDVLSDGSQASVIVPATAVTGAVRLELSDGSTVPGSVSLQIVPTASAISIPAEEAFVAGVEVSIDGTGFRAGATEVAFPPANLDVVSALVSNANTRLAVTLPVGVAAGEAFVLTDGGISNPLPILIFGLIGVAQEGTATDPLTASANIGQTITVTGSDLSEDLAAVFGATNDVGSGLSIDVSLSNVSANAMQAEVIVPAGAISGSVRLRAADGILSPADAMLQIVPTLSSFTVPPGQVLQPGVTATLNGTGFRIGQSDVELPGLALVSPDTDSLTSITVTVPGGLGSGEVAVVTDGGRSRGIPLPGTFGLSATADLGVPANATEASANVGQTITVTGDELSTDLRLVVPSVSDGGANGTLELPLLNVAPDRTSASAVLGAGASSGTVYLRHTDGAAATSTVMLQVVPTLDTLEVPDGQAFGPGTVATLRGSGFVEGQSDVAFPGAAAVTPASDVFDSGASLTVTIPVGVEDGVVSVTTSGGTSPGVNIVLDADGDGLSDLDEVNIHGTNPFVADTDGDGLSDGDEVNVHGTNPLEPDSDDDGLDDGAEVGLGTDPTVPDSDSDGLDDGEEILIGTEPLDEDSDDDGIEDGAEVDAGLDPLDGSDAAADPDGDGLSSAEEIGLGTNPFRSDTDSDGLSDGDEVNTRGTDPLNPDTDSGGRTDGDEVLVDGTDPLDGSDDRVELPIVLQDSDTFRWDIRGDGTIRDGSNNAFDGAFDLVVDGGFFSFFPSGTAEELGREIVIGPWTRSGLIIRRKVFVPEDDSFARFLEVFENFNGFDVPVSIELRSDLGAGNRSEIITTSDGDQVFERRDDFIVLDDGTDGGGNPAVTHVFSGPGAEVEPSSVSTNIPGGDDFSVRFDFTVPAQGRAIVMHFGMQSHDRGAAATRAEGLTFVEGSALFGLAPDEQLDVVNLVPFADSDRDGATDSEELAAGTLLDNPDSDGDGLLDGFELDNGLNPLEADSDGNGTNDDLEDPDGDGLTNAEEQTLGTDPSASDSDGDGLDDGAEVNGSPASDPLNPDTDGDTLSDGEEVNVHGTDPTKADSDDGGRTDAQEINEDGTDPLDGADDRVVFPATLFDGAGFLWDINSDGLTINGTIDAFDGGLQLYINGQRFRGPSFGSAEDLGRELVIGTDRLSRLDVTRKVFVPEDGVFARYLEILENPDDSPPCDALEVQALSDCVAEFCPDLDPACVGSACVAELAPLSTSCLNCLGATSPIDVCTDAPSLATVEIRTHLGSGRATQLVLTSDGDQAFERSDDFIITDDADGAGDPTVVHAFSGPFAEIEPISVYTNAPGREEVRFAFNVEVPDGGRAIIMHFASQNDDRANAEAGAHTLVGLEGSTLSGLSAAEMNEVVNFFGFPDSDDDGLADAEEDLLGTDSNNPDSDGDGLLDGVEVANGLDPLVRDSDGNGTDDGAEDGDADGLDNLTEQTIGTDPGVADSDGDGLLDGAEVAGDAGNGVPTTDPLNADSDSDGLSDGDEVLVWGTDPTLADTDGGGRSDSQEVNEDQTDPLDPTDDAIVLPTDLFDSEGFRWDIQGDGRIGDGSSGAYEGGKGLTVNGTAFPSLAVARVEDDGREVVVGPWTEFGLDIRRKIFVPENEAFARYLEIFENPASCAAVEVEAVNDCANALCDATAAFEVFQACVAASCAAERSAMPLACVSCLDAAVSIADATACIGDSVLVAASLGSNLGSDYFDAVQIIATSSGDQILDRDDGYVITDDSTDGGGVPAVTDVFAGRRYSIPPTNAFFGQVDDFPPRQRVLVDYDFTVPVRGRVLLMHFAAQRNLGLEAGTSAASLTYLDGEALNGLSQSEQEQIVNFVAFADRDRDGLTDDEESVLGTNPELADSDGDSLKDGFEVEFGFDPLVSDEDGNTIDDGLDDTDLDGVDNATEEAAGSDPTVADTDGDGLTDGEEVNNLGTDPSDADSDDDGLTDGEEVNVHATDPLAPDTDGGGQLDGDEVLRDRTDPIEPSDDEVLTLFSLDRGSALLRRLDPSTGAILSSLAITMQGASVRGGSGLATHPVTGQLFALLEVNDRLSRDLATIDPHTGEATSIGNTGAPFAALAFGQDGTLYGLTGERGATPETLFELDQATGAATQLTTLGSGSGGEALALNPLDGLLYRASGRGRRNIDRIFETVDPSDFSVEMVMLFGDDSDQLRALTYAGANRFVAFDRGRDFYTLSADGRLRKMGRPGVESKGLAFVRSAFIDLDADGLTGSEEAAAGTDPQDPDTDDDGLLDGFEVDNGLDPLIPGDENGDLDSDGLTNFEEQTIGTDPAVADTDGDGLSDGDEVNVHGTDPLDPDSEGDGLSDGDEINVYGSNPLSRDSDGGSRPDGVEVNRDGTDPTDPNDDLPSLYSLDRNAARLHLIDVSDGSTLATTELSVFAMGLATNPETGELWTFVGGGQLSTVDPITGAFGVVGYPPEFFEAITFDNDGNLLGVTSYYGASPGSLFFISTLDASVTPIRPLTSPSNFGSHALAFHNNSGLVYHSAGDYNSASILETVDLTTLQLEMLPLSGFSFREPTALTYAGNSEFFATDYGRDFMSIRDDGFVRSLGTLSHTSAGLALVGVSLADRDLDGLSDSAEAVLGTNPEVADSDGDGLEDGFEVENGFDPLDPDEDGNTIDDGQDDPDGDGLDSAAEQSLGTNPTQSDTDGDGLDDGEEVNVEGTDPLVADSDRDGLDDGEEIDSFGTDPLDADSDDDGFKDGVEINSGSDPLAPGSVPFLLLYGLERFGSGSLYRIDPGSGTAYAVGETGISDWSALAVDPNGVMYATQFFGGLFKIDPLTAAADLIGPTLDALDDLAFRSSDGSLFAATDFSQFGTIDVTTGSGTVVANLGCCGTGGLAFSADDTLYQTQRDDLKILDPTTGQTTSLGRLQTPPGLSLFDTYAIDFRPGSNDLFVLYEAYPARLGVIDPSTAQLTDIGPTASDLVGLAWLPAPGGVDTDGDTLPDATEALVGSDPALIDTDGDGLTDGEEVRDVGTDPNDADTDDDTVNDGDEVDAGRDPLAADPTPTPTDTPTPTHTPPDTPTPTPSPTTATIGTATPTPTATDTPSGPLCFRCDYDEHYCECQDGTVVFDECVLDTEHVQTCGPRQQDCEQACIAIDGQFPTEVFCAQNNAFDCCGVVVQVPCD